MASTGGRQRLGSVLFANPQEYVIELRSAIVALLVGTTSTVVWQAVRQALLPSIALGVAATFIALLVNFRRRSRRLQALGRVLSDPSSSGSAFTLLQEVRVMAGQGTKPARIADFIQICVSRRRYPHRELAAPILDELNNPSCDLSRVVAHCENALAARSRVRARAVERLAEFLAGQSPKQLILYGYSSTACEGLVGAAKRGWNLPEVVVIRDEQYGSDSVNEHEDVIKALASIVTIQPDDVVDLNELDKRLSESGDHSLALIGCDAVDPAGRILVPGVTEGALSGTGLLLDRLTSVEDSCQLVVVGETFKIAEHPFEEVERTSSPSKLNLPIKLLARAGLAAPFRGQDVRLLELSEEVDALVTDAGILPRPAKQGVPPSWHGAWLIRNNTSGAKPPRPAPGLEGRQDGTVRLRLDEIDGVIFDCNGVIVDDEPDHFAAFATVVEKDTGSMLTWQQYEELCQGKTDRDGVRALRQHGLIECPVQDAVKAKQKAYRKAVRDPTQNLVPGVAEFIQLLAEKGITRHLITAGDSDWVEGLLAGHVLGPGIDGEVSCGVTHADRQQRMREILRRANLKPRRTILLDDSETNLALAQALHIRTVCIRTTGDARPSGAAEFTVADFEELLQHL